MSNLRKSAPAALAAVAVATAVAAPAYGATSSQEGYSSVGPSVTNLVDNGSGPGVSGTNAATAGSGGAATANAAAATDHSAGPAATSTLSGHNDPDNGSGSGRLPFTGSDLGFLAAAGGFLLAAGVGLRRLTRATTSV